MSILALLCSFIVSIGSQTVPDHHQLGHRVIDAINCGGGEHTDLYGIHYRADPQRVGVASDFGSRLIIARTHAHDSILYQTERYHNDHFSYEVHLPVDDADYVIVLKFCEVYFQAPNEKVFSVLLNDQPILPHVDIYAQAGGYGIAYDEVVPFSISAGNLVVQERSSPFAGKLKITFAKGPHDNPKINAFYVIKGSAQDIPELPPMPTNDDDDVDEEDDASDKSDNTRSDSHQRQQSSSKLASGPRISDPYQQQDNSHMLLPILIALACFFPVLFCLCKL